MTRRQLTLAAFAALCGCQVWAEAPKHAGAEKLGWKLTLQSWTIQKTTYESIDIARQLGIKYLEVYPGQPLSPEDKSKFGPGMTDAQIDAVLAKAKSAGVTIIDCGVIDISGKESDARKLFEWAKKVGITTLVSEPDPKALPLIDKLAGEFGIPVGIHDHQNPNKYWNPEYVFSLIRDLKHVGFTADVGHWKRSGLDPVEVLRVYGEKVYTLHFKDLVPDEGKKSMHDVVWGTGQCKAAEMLQVLKAKGFKGPIALEYESKWDVPTLQKCVDFFNAEADKLAER